MRRILPLTFLMLLGSSAGAAEDPVSPTLPRPTSPTPGENESSVEEKLPPPKRVGYMMDPKRTVAGDRKLADAGDAEAQFNIGLRYHSGRDGFPVDHTEAAKWFRKSAEQGLHWAQAILGSCYRYGWGVPRDGVEAAKWYHKAAAQGSVSSCCGLGELYDKGGVGIPPNPAEAMKWYRRAANYGYADAKNWLIKNMKPEDSANRVNRLLNLAKENPGDSRTRIDLAWMYYLGIDGAKQDYAEAAKWLLKDPYNRSPWHQYDLGYMYAVGLGVPKDSVESERRYASAAKLLRARPSSNASVTVKLGTLYYFGKGVRQDYLQASRFYRLSAEHGGPRAQYILGFMYANGLGVARDLIEAKKWFRKAAANAPITSPQVPEKFEWHTECLTEALQDSPPNNPKESVKRWIEAANAGDPVAEYNLGVAYACDFNRTLNPPPNTATKDGGNPPHTKGRRQQDSAFRSEVMRSLTMSEDARPVVIPLKAFSFFTPFAFRPIVPNETPVIRSAPRYIPTLPRTPDYAEAGKWYRRSADHGYLPAIEALALMAESDVDGVGLNRSNAKELWERALAQGSTLALEQLGEFYVTGNLTGKYTHPVDYVEAYALFSVYGDLCCPPNTLRREEIGDMLTPDELKKAQARAKVIWDALPVAVKRSAAEGVPVGSRRFEKSPSADKTK